MMNSFFALLAAAIALYLLVHGPITVQDRDQARQFVCTKVWTCEK